MNVQKKKKYSNITLVKDAIHSPSEPRHWMSVVVNQKPHEACIEGTTVASAKQVWIMHEVAHIVIAPVTYFHPDDLDMSYFVESKTTSHCPLKGNASYFHAVFGDKVIHDVAWTYADPIEEASVIKDLVAFNERLASVVKLS